MRLIPLVLMSAAAALAVPVTGLSLGGVATRMNGDAPLAETVTIVADSISYPLPGEYLADGRVVAPPVVSSGAMRFHIMRYQVNRADYGRCVAAGACAPPSRRTGPDDAPVTGVSSRDAEAYAAWYSARSGSTWRLPTAMEAAVAAGDRFSDQSAAAADDPANPATRWLGRYRDEAAKRRAPDPVPKPQGFYGVNDRDVADFGGNVWEWTATCYTRVTLDAEGGVRHRVENCGVRVLEGRHRAYMTEFIREGTSGGCAVGTPPDNLGFRLVREEPTFSLVAWLATLIGKGGAA